jgi:short-subunit dehydrogenase
VSTPKKFILITGGSRGIGKSAVEILASTKNNIILTTRKINSNLLSWA